MKTEVAMVLCYTFSILLLCVGAFFYSTQAADHIRGYVDMSAKEKETVNIKPLCRNLGVMFFLAAIIFGIAGYSEWFRLVCFKWAMIGWIVLCCADIVFINKSGRYINETLILKQGGKR